MDSDLAARSRLVVGPVASSCCFRWTLCLLAVVWSAAVFAPDVSAQLHRSTRIPAAIRSVSSDSVSMTLSQARLPIRGTRPEHPLMAVGSRCSTLSAFSSRAGPARSILPIPSSSCFEACSLVACDPHARLDWVQHMFGRGFNLSSLLNYFMLIGFALIILDNYYRPTHNFFPPEYGFVQVVARQVTTWSQEIYRTTEVEFDAAFATSRRILDTGADNAQFLADNDPRCGR